MFILGYCFEKGEGVRQDIVNAVKLYYNAAQGGNADAQFNVGRMFESGQYPGVPQNKQEAVKWYTMAAEQGNQNAVDALRWMDGDLL